MVDRFEHFSGAIVKISRAWRKLACEEMAKHGLRGPHATYLITIDRFQQGITVPQICELTGKDKSDASRMIGILEEKQMVERILSPGSTYRGKIVLTEKGKEAAQQVKKRAVRAVEIAGKDLARTVFPNKRTKLTIQLRNKTKRKADKNEKY